MRYSIVIPMYNVQDYIERCLYSIFNQDFDDYELILVDDESSDKTLQIVHHIVDSFGKEPCTTIISKKNSGASDTRNAGIKVAQGEYVIFMDADDQMTDNALSVMDKATREVDADLYVFSLKKNIDGVIKESNLSKIDDFRISAENSVRCLEQYLKMTHHIITWQPWSKVFRRSIIKNNDVAFDTTLYCCNDFDFFMKYCMCVQTVSFCNIPTTIYTVDRPGSISITKQEKRLLSSTKAYSGMFYRIKESGIDSPDLLSYMSYLFLCALETASKLTKEQNLIMEEIVHNHREVYLYANDRVSKLKRFCFERLGFKKGVRVIELLRKMILFFGNRNSDI